MQNLNKSNLIQVSKTCSVRSVKFTPAEQYQLIDRQITHDDIPPLWVTFGQANINFKNYEQITVVKIEDIHGEVIGVDFDDDVLTCEVLFEVRPEVAEVIKNNDVYLSALYTVIDDRVINLIRMYANVLANYTGSTQC